MKIAFVGNQDNNAYRICIWLRERNIDVHLYMFRQEVGTRSRPELIDVKLAENFFLGIRMRLNLDCTAQKLVQEKT